MTEMMPIFFLLLSAHHPEYKGSFEATTQAVYKTSDLKSYVDSATNIATKNFPELIRFGSLGYAIGIKKEAEFKTSKILPIDNSQTSFKGNRNEGKVEFRFGI